MKALNIKQNNPDLLPANLVNLLDLNPKDMSMNILGNEELDMFYVKYDGSPLYLVVDNIRGFIEENSGAKYLTIVFPKENQRFMYDKVWKEIKKLCEIDIFGKSYDVIMFKSDDNVSGMIDISSMTVIIKAVLRDSGVFYPQICLNYCPYDV